MHNISICRICGDEFKQKTKGRKREYCNDNCRDYYKFYSALDKVLSNMDFQTLESIKHVKTDLFALVNALPKKVNEKDHHV